MPGSSNRRLPAADLAHVLAHTHGIWEDLRGARLFVTGGTGFFGRWMVESFLGANDEYGLRARVTVLTRDARRFSASAPHVAGHEAVTLIEADVGSFEAPAEDWSHVLHMATQSGPGLTPVESFRTAVHGTERVLRLAAERGARKLLLTSSGAVYGPQRLDCDRLEEEDPAAARPEDPTAGYANGKRAAEFLWAAAASETGIRATIARCFAFVGPVLPLDANFAIGNFIRDALVGDRIEVTGDGTARRSYLYAADLATWLWTILVKGVAGRPYNVGSDVDISVADLARLVADVVRPGLPVHVAVAAQPGKPPSRYVPSVARATHELGLGIEVPLDEAIRRTAQWHSL